MLVTTGGAPYVLFLEGNLGEASVGICIYGRSSW